MLPEIGPTEAGDGDAIISKIRISAFSERWVYFLPAARFSGPSTRVGAKWSAKSLNVATPCHFWWIIYQFWHISDSGEARVSGAVGGVYN